MSKLLENLIDLMAGLLLITVLPLALLATGLALFMVIECLTGIDVLRMYVQPFFQELLNK